MTAIAQLAGTDTLKASDRIPVGTGSGDRSIAFADLLTAVQSALTEAGPYVTQYAAPAATAFSIAVVAPVVGAAVRLIVMPAALYAAGTVVLPPLPVDGQTMVAHFVTGVTALTVSGGAATVSGAPTTVAAGGFFRFDYDGTLNRWHRVG